MQQLSESRSFHAPALGPTAFYEGLVLVSIYVCVIECVHARVYAKRGEEGTRKKDRRQQRRKGKQMNGT